jgi:hypothetical protein
MSNVPLKQRAGKNIGVESLPVFLIAAGAPEVPVPSIAAATPGGTPAVLLEGVADGLRTPTVRGAISGYAFNNGASDVVAAIYFVDDLGNKMRIAEVPVTAALGYAPLDLTGDNVFNTEKVLSLDVGEKLTCQAYLSGSG